MTPRFTDPGELARLRARDPELLEELAQELSPRIWIAIRRFARDDQDADDLLQDCWIHILQRLDSFRRSGSFAGWAITVSRNVCRKKLRGERRAAVTPVTLDAMRETPSTDPDALELLQASRERETLYAALARLPSRERDAIVLRVLEGRSARETARMLEVSVSAARSAVRRGVARLRRMREVRKLMMDWMAAD